MSNKENNKKHNNFNSEESNAEFFKQCFEFNNAKSINEKYEKGEARIITEQGARFASLACLYAER